MNAARQGAAISQGEHHDRRQPNQSAPIAAATLLVASGAVTIAAISSMPAANAQALFRNTLMRQMDDCVINATEISIPRERKQRHPLKLLCEPWWNVVPTKRRRSRRHV
jgi:hypothetical protein